MRITRIDVEGNAGHFALISRRAGSEFIDVEIICPELTRTHHVAADQPDDIWSMAECLRETLGGIPCDVRDYFNVLNRLAD